MKPTKVIIMGAAGRDFHNFNVVFRENPAFDVVAFTATQIPNIDGRRYPSELSGDLYPDGIPIYPESKLEDLIRRLSVKEVVFSYSDVTFEYVMGIGARVNAAGASFKLLGTRETMLQCSVPVIAVVAVRTGAGKSQTSRRVCEILRKHGLRVTAIRHPMPYGDLAKQQVQRYATLEDLVRHECTVEEMEEYEPHIMNGGVIYSGVDYGAIRRDAESESDVIVWDGGNNDTSFFRPDLTITVVDPHRPGHELSYYPGATNLLLADVVVINKMDSASPENIRVVRENVARVNPEAIIVEAKSPISIDAGDHIKGKRVLVVEDGPTLTHGEMKYGAGMIAARNLGAAEIVDPRPWAVNTIAETFQKYPGIGPLLPAMGYGPEQVRDLEQTINATECDTVVIGTPIDLTRIVRINKPAVRASYSLEEQGTVNLESIIVDLLRIKGRPVRAKVEPAEH